MSSESPFAIKVENLGKQYVIGKEKTNQPFSSQLKQWLKNPFARREKPPTFWAVNDISFDVAPGEVVGIIGNNGAGKSTLLKMLSHITEPTCGRAVINGRVGSLLEVGTGFHPELTGRENIYLNGAILGMPSSEIAAKFDEIVDFAEIGPFLDTPVKRYSSGMYVRLAFAVAANLDSSVLIVDEVLAVGDVRFQRKCLGKMDSIAEGGRTVLFVSHNLPAVRSLCHRVILMESGKIKLDGETQSVIRQYLEEETCSAAVKTWKDHKRPGNVSCRINRIRLLDARGMESNTLNISEGGSLDIDFDVTEERAQVGFSIDLFDVEGNSIFSSISNQEPHYYGKQMAIGRYQSTCRIPGDLLNNGSFYLSLSGFSANWTDGFKLDQMLHIQAVDDGVLKGDYSGGFSGSTRPRLEWTTEKANAPKMASALTS